MIRRIEMLNRNLIIQTATEDDCIEHIRCMERLENEGLSRI